jgi:hypothetical protein
MGNSICPRCHQALSTPPLMNLQEWSSFVCPSCRARLRQKSTLRSNHLLLFGLSLASLGGFHFAPRWLKLLFIVLGLVSYLAAFVILLFEARSPELQLKKPLPKPEIVLNLNNLNN